MSQSEPERKPERAGQRARESQSEPERARESQKETKRVIWEADYKREAGLTSLACLRIVLLQNCKI